MPNSPRPTARLVRFGCLAAATLVLGGCLFHATVPVNPPSGVTLMVLVPLVP